MGDGWVCGRGEESGCPDVGGVAGESLLSELFRCGGFCGRWGVVAEWGAFAGGVMLGCDAGSSECHGFVLVW